MVAVISNIGYEAYQAFKQSQLNAAIATGIAAMEPGKAHDSESAFDNLIALADEC
ncbi:MAG: hypothetical protein V7784_06665 [Oceanospirillaceae bacterium]